MRQATSIIAAELEVLEENNYYPFGLKHEGYNTLGNTIGYDTMGI
jgi:hypothetical protein